MKKLQNAADESGLFLLLAYFLIGTFGTYVIATIVVYLMVPLIFGMVGLDTIHKNVPEKRSQGVAAAALFLVILGLLSIINRNYFV